MAAESRQPHPMEALHQNTTPVVPRVKNMASVVPKIMFYHGSKEKLCSLKSGHPSPTGTLTAYLLFLSHLKIAQQQQQQTTTTDSDGIREHGGKEIAGTPE